MKVQEGTLFETKKGIVNCERFFLLTININSKKFLVYGKDYAHIFLSSMKEIMSLILLVFYDSIIKVEYNLFSKSVLFGTEEGINYYG